jgi:hypothetical protein
MDPDSEERADLATLAFGILGLANATVSRVARISCPGSLTCGLLFFPALTQIIHTLEHIKAGGGVPFTQEFARDQLLVVNIARELSLKVQKGIMVRLWEAVTANIRLGKGSARAAVRAPPPAPGPSVLATMFGGMEFDNDSE